MTISPAAENARDLTLPILPETAAIGQEIAPAGVNAANLWADTINAEGGIAGCKFTLDVKEETFGDVPACLRQYKDAIASGEYQFMLGPTNSACMFALPELTSAAGIPLISGIAADHQPFLEQWGPLQFHASVSTFLEGRASAVFAAKQGWKKVGIVAPNYAYGQDAAKAFKQYFLQLVPDGEIVAEQYPEFNEDNFTPIINAIVSKQPDGVFSAFFGPFIVPFWKQWKATGHEDIPTIGGLVVLATFDVIKDFDSEVPANSYGYDRAPWQLLSLTPTGKKWSDLYAQNFGDKAPIVSSFAYQMFNALQLAKGLIEKTQSTDGAAWQAAVEAGDFTFDGVYQFAPTPVNPINHMGDNCAAVGLVVKDDSLPVTTTYDVNSFVPSCMDDILTQDEAAALTNRPDQIPQEALDAYQANVDAAKQARAGQWPNT